MARSGACGKFMTPSRSDIFIRTSTAIPRTGEAHYDDDGAGNLGADARTRDAFCARAWGPAGHLWARRGGLKELNPRRAGDSCSRILRFMGWRDEAHGDGDGAEDL